jgi:hypothetical protein
VSKGGMAMGKKGCKAGRSTKYNSRLRGERSGERSEGSQRKKTNQGIKDDKEDRREKKMQMWMQMQMGMGMREVCAGQEQQLTYTGSFWLLQALYMQVMQVMQQDQMPGRGV